MMNSKLKFTILSALLVGVLTGLIAVIFASAMQENNEFVSTQPQVLVEGEYAMMPLDQMISLSNTIFVGKVTKVSQSQWNQDNGEVWNSESVDYSPFQIHYVELEIINPIVDTIGIDSHVVITVSGPNPTDEGYDYLKEGDQVIYFALKTKISWKDGVREVLRQTNAHLYSYFLLEKDGLYHGETVDGPLALSLEQWTQQIEDVKELQTNP